MYKIHSFLNLVKKNREKSRAKSGDLVVSGTLDVMLYDSERDGYITVDYKRCRKGVLPEEPAKRKPIEQLSEEKTAIRFCLIFFFFFRGMTAHSV